MQAYSAYYENGLIIPIGNPIIPEKRKLAILVLDDEFEQQQEYNTKIPRESMFGCMKGKMRVPDNYDEPLDDFKEYMQA